MAKFIVTKNLTNIPYKNADSPSLSLKTGDSIEGTLECFTPTGLKYSCSVIYQNNYMISATDLTFVSGTDAEKAMLDKMKPNFAIRNMVIGLGIIAVILVIIGILKLFKVF